MSPFVFEVKNMKKWNNYNQKYDDRFYVNTDNIDLLPKESQKNTPINNVFEWLDVIITALIAVVLVFSFISRVANIEGDSMLNTLHENDKVVISNFNYTVKAGDIVVISRNANNSIKGSLDKTKGPIIKRVIATENQIVDIDFETGTVYVDGKKLNETYTSTPTTRKDDLVFPAIVPKGCVFVLGDNRTISLDSRSSQIGDNGMIDTRYILGRAVFRIFPFNKIGRLDNK